jgi:very-short-patch-repair endonuclease
MGFVHRTVSSHAAKLRRDRTDAEELFWQAVRNRQLGGYKFRFQHSIYPYIVDFACVQAKLIVELDGGQHSEERDAGRTKALEAHGWRVMRCWNNDVIANLEGVLTAVLGVLEERASQGRRPSPNPLPHAGEG